MNQPQAWHARWIWNPAADGRSEANLTQLWTMRPIYNSDIPDDAGSRITHRYPGGERRIVKFFMREGLCGIRTYYSDGTLESEESYREGLRHGMKYEWYESGQLWSSAPYERGLPHGTARQWSCDGRQLGAYTMANGTGIDLWWQEREDGSVFLSEARYLRDGKRIGFEWWINEDQLSVYIERHWHNSKLHGIEREWDGAGRLQPGFPRFHVGGQQVEKSEYAEAPEHNLTWPAYRATDDNAVRVFPPEVASALRPPDDFGGTTG